MRLSFKDLTRLENICMAQTLLVHTNFSFHPPKAAASIHGKSTKLQWTKKKNPPLMDQNQTCRLIKASTCNNWCSEQMIIMIFIEYPTPQSHKILPRFHNHRTSKIPTNIFMSISLTVVYIYIYMLPTFAQLNSVFDQTELT